MRCQRFPKFIASLIKLSSICAFSSPCTHAIMASMTEADVIAHWRKGARDALEMAQLALQAGKYDHALFNCQLAVEKALKAKIMEKNKEASSENSRSPEAVAFGASIVGQWKRNELFDIVSSFCRCGAMSDLFGAQQYATAEHATND